LIALADYQMASVFARFSFPLSLNFSTVIFNLAYLSCFRLHVVTRFAAEYFIALTSGSFLFQNMKNLLSQLSAEFRSRSFEHHAESGRQLLRISFRPTIIINFSLISNLCSFTSCIEEIRNAGLVRERGMRVEFGPKLREGWPECHSPNVFSSLACLAALFQLDNWRCMLSIEPTPSFFQ
jgi:hypothetical protein